jgi:DNA-binding GntR family transcriptional regulator
MESTTLLTALRHYRLNDESHAETAYRIMKEKIITLQLPPASLLSEAQLMAELGLGRTPIREALQRLALDNLVVILPRRGTIVADLNIQDLQKIFEVRLELEPFCCRLAAVRASERQIEEMEALFATADEIIRTGDNYQLMRLDHAAHLLLAQAAHNEFLFETLDRLYSHVLRLWYISLHRVGRMREAIEEHRQIVTAVKTGNGERAAEIMRQHILDFQAELT